MKVNITIENIRLRSNSTNINTMRFTENTKLGFTQNISRPLSDIKVFDQFIQGTYESDKPNKIIGVVKVHLNCDCINGSIVNGVTEQIFYSNSSINLK